MMGGRLVGFVSFCEKQIDGLRGKKFFFGNLAAGKGTFAGKALLNRVLEEARSRGYRHAYFNVDTRKKGVLKSYEAIGAARAVTLRQKIRKLVSEAKRRALRAPKKPAQTTGLYRIRTRDI